VSDQHDQVNKVSYMVKSLNVEGVRDLKKKLSLANECLKKGRETYCLPPLQNQSAIALSIDRATAGPGLSD
jgi:hypothetical protein